MTQTLQDVRLWMPRLQPGEELLWVGRPRWHMKLDKTALLFSVPAGVASLAVLIDRTWLLEKLGVPQLGGMNMPAGDLLMLKWTAALALIYITLYLYGHMVVSPRFTRYALSNRRAFVRTSFIWPKVRDKRLTPVTPIRWDGVNPGSITFATYEKNYGAKPKSKLGTANTVETRDIGFSHIDDADKVHAMMLDVAQGPMEFSA